MVANPEKAELVREFQLLVQAVCNVVRNLTLGQVVATGTSFGSTNEEGYRVPERRDY